MQRASRSSINGRFNSRIGRASTSTENIGEYAEVTQKSNRAEIVKFLKNNEINTLNDRVKKNS